MPYDLHTPFGIQPGQVSPAEMLQSQTASNARRRAMDEDAQSAQLHALKAAVGGGGGDQFFSEAGPFGIAPKQTGAIDLGSRNAAVDQRQQRTAGMRDMLDLAKPKDYLTATQHGDMARLKYGADKAGMEEDEQIRSLTSPMIQDLIKQMGGQGGATGAPMNPNAGANGGINLGAMGGSAPAAGGSGDLNTKLRTLAALRSMRGGGAVPDFQSQDEDRDFRRQERDLTLRTQKATLSQKERELQRGNEDADRMRTDPYAVTGKYPEVTAPLAQMASNFVSQDTKMVGWDPTDDDMNTLVQERDRAAAGLANRGLDPAKAMQEANRAILTALGPNRNDLNSGATRKLLARLGVSKAAPARPTDDFDPNAMNYGPSL